MFVVPTGTADAAIRPERQLEFRGYEFELNVAIGVGLALLIVKVVLAVAGSAIGVTYARRVLESLRARLTNALLEAAPLLVQAEKGGMMQDRLTTWCERVAASTETFRSMVAATLSLGAFLLVAALVDFRAVVLLLLLGIVVMGAIRPIIRRIRHAADRLRAEAGIAPDLLTIKPLWENKVAAILEEATLKIPENNWMQSGGKDGRHTEHLGYILAEMQHLQRTYPGNEW